MKYSKILDFNFSIGFFGKKKENSLIQRNILPKDNWFIHKGLSKSISNSKEKIRIRINNSKCFPLIKDQYQR